MLQKDTKSGLALGSTLFVNYLTATLHDIASTSKSNSLQAEHVFKALEILEFEQFIPLLKTNLEGEPSATLSA